MRGGRPEVTTPRRNICINRRFGSRLGLVVMQSDAIAAGREAVGQRTSQAVATAAGDKHRFQGVGGRGIHRGFPRDDGGIEIVFLISNWQVAVFTILIVSSCCIWRATDPFLSRLWFLNLMDFKRRMSIFSRKIV